MRNRLKAIRLAMSDLEYKSESLQICEQLQSLPVLRSAGCIHVYWPHIGWREPDIRPFIQYLLKSSVRVALPVIRAFRSASDLRRMAQVQFDTSTELRKNQWGIDEPYGDNVVPIGELDAVVVPALGVDPVGNRLGYGGGFYDEFLSEIDVTLVCPIFSRCIVDEVPRETHDIPVHWIVSEGTCINTGKT